MSINKGFDVRGILSKSSVYSLFAKLMVPEPWQPEFVARHMEVKPSQRVLDIGCGPADILTFLPDVDYVGYDMNADYIQKAKDKYTDQGTFICQKIEAGMASEQAPFDVVLALGVLHHLTDVEADILLRTAKENLKPSGRLVTLDGACTDNQSFVARWLLDHDRGDHVRTAKAYESLVRQHFMTVDVSMRSDILRLPYDHCIMVCEL